MTDYEKFIASGILAAYVRGETSTEENQVVNLMADLFSEVSAKINQLYEEIENDALENAVEWSYQMNHLLVIKTLSQKLIFEIQGEEQPHCLITVCIGYA